VIVFDIETGPLPTAELEDRIPNWEAPANYKNDAKIAAYITQKRLDWIERAALDATTGKILAIGILDCREDGVEKVNTLAGDEAEIIAAFSSIVMQCGGSGWPLVGWGIFGFDLPFILRRSWILRVALPEWIRSGRYWDRCFVDAMDVWACGNREQAVSLDLAAATLGVGRKSGSGAHFASLWNGSDEERAHALAYLENDLRLTKAVAERILPAGSRVIERRAA
jgi:hypothetical protein